MTGIEEANVQTVVAYVEAYNRKDIEGMMAWPKMSFSST